LLPGDAAAASIDADTLCCFNPHPALLPGDAMVSSICDPTGAVSIRTLHCCRVMLLAGGA